MTFLFACVRECDNAILKRFACGKVLPPIRETTSSVVIVKKITVQPRYMFCWKMIMRNPIECCCTLHAVR